MNTHTPLSDYSVSDSRITPIGKGREGKGDRKGREAVPALVCGVDNSDQIQSNRYLGSFAAPIGIGAMA